MRLLVDEECDEDSPSEILPYGSGDASSRQRCTSSNESAPSLASSTSPLMPVDDSEPNGGIVNKRKKPMLISGSLDNTIKMWDIETGETVRTFFGHIEGLWAIASDKLRLVSGSHDRTIKVFVNSLFAML
jgi:F-box/WD-40 domain protein MET30